MGIKEEAEVIFKDAHKILHRIDQQRPASSYNKSASPIVSLNTSWLLKSTPLISPDVTSAYRSDLPALLRRQITARFTSRET